jgi:hypothetical protein
MAEKRAMEALTDLRRQLDETVAQLLAAGERLDELHALRTSGASWREIVADERRPLVVERITAALHDLGEVGGRFRREEALALQREGVSIKQIGELFGVTRQRASALVHGHPANRRPKIVPGRRR